MYERGIEVVYWKVAFARMILSQTRPGKRRRERENDTMLMYSLPRDFEDRTVVQKQEEYSRDVASCGTHMRSKILFPVKHGKREKKRRHEEACKISARKSKQIIVIEACRSR